MNCSILPEMQYSSAEFCYISGLVNALPKSMGSQGCFSESIFVFQIRDLFDKFAVRLGLMLWDCTENTEPHNINRSMGESVGREGNPV